MKSLPKILLGLVGLVLAAVALLVVAVAVLFDPKDYQPLLEESVAKATGRKLALEGDLGLDLFPCCAVTLGRATLGNPPGFGEGHFARVDSAALNLKIWPLIARREVAIGAVRLEGLDANLQVRKDGVANWEFDAAPGSEAPEAASEGAAVGQLAIEGVEIRGGRVSYRDEQDGSAYLVENLELTTGELAPGAPFDLALAARLTDEADGTAGDVALKAVATLDAGLETLSLAKPRMEITAAGKAIPARSLKATLGAAELAIDASEDTVFQFRGLQGDIALPGLEALAGDLAGSFNGGDARLAVGKSSELTLPTLAAEFTLSGAEIPGETIATTLKAGAIGVDVDKLWGSVESFTADVNGLGARAEITGAGRFAESGASLVGTLKLDPLSPRSVLAVLKEPAPRTADPEALTRLGGRADWSVAKNSLQLTKLDLQLDQTRLTGSLGRIGADAPVTRFDLALDAIDLDRYLAPDAEGEGAATGSSGEAAEDIPVEALRGLRLDGRLGIGKLTFAKAKFADVAATVRAADGRLRLDPLAASLYGGRYRGAVTIDASGPVAKLVFDQQLEALQVGGALKDLYDTDKLTGALSGRVSASGSGNSTDALLKTLGGDVSLKLADGAYLGTDLWHELRSARARIRGDAPPPAPADPRTKLQALEFAGPIRDGVLRADRLLAEIPFIRLSGTGVLDLVAETIDYRLQAQVFETPTFDDGTSFDDLTGLTIPLTLEGPMGAPKVGVEIKKLAAGAATQKLKERLLKKLGGDESAPTDSAATGEQAAPSQQPPKEEKPRDVLKRSLRDLLKPP